MGFKVRLDRLCAFSQSIDMKVPIKLLNTIQITLLDCWHLEKQNFPIVWKTQVEWYKIQINTV